MAALALVWDLIARDQASPTFNRVAASADRAAASTERASVATAGFGKKAVAALGALVTVDVGVHMVKEAIRFESAMKLIKTQAGASSAELTSMSKAVLGLAGPLATSPMQLAKALYPIESAGYRASDALKILTASAQLAKVGQSDLVKTTDALVGLMQTGIVGGANNAGKAIGMMNAVVGAGKMTMTDFVEATGTGLFAVAKTFGVSFESVGAALATMTDQGIPAAEAATKIRMAITLIGAPSAKATSLLSNFGLTAQQTGAQVTQTAQMLKLAGVSTLTLADDLKKPNGISVALTDLMAHLKGSGLRAEQAAAVIARSFGGGRSSGGILQLLANLGLLDQKFVNITTHAKEFPLAWKATEGGTSFALSRLAAEAEAAGISFGQKMLPAVRVVATWLADTLPGAVSKVMAALHPLTSAVGGTLAGAWHVLSSVLGAVGSALSSVGNFFAGHSRVVSAFAGAVLAMWAAFKGYQIALAAKVAILGVFDTIRLRAMYASDAVVGWGRNTGAAFTSLGAASVRSAAVQTASSLQVELATANQAVVTTASAAEVAEAKLAEARAVGVASAEEIAALEAEAAAAAEQALAAVGAAATVSEAADLAAADVVASGEAASIGWASVLGPLALVGVGIAAVAMLFRKTGSESKDAAEDVSKLTGDVSGFQTALQSGSKIDIFSVASANLVANDFPNKIKALNADLGNTGPTLAQATAALVAGDPAMSKYSDSLQKVIDKNQVIHDGAQAQVKDLTKQQGLWENQQTVAGKAKEAEITGQLRVQRGLVATSAARLADSKTAKAAYDAVVDAQQKAIDKDNQQIEANGGVAASALDIAKKYGLSVDQLANYASVAGIVVTKTGQIDAAQKNAAEAIAGAYATADSAALGSLNAFSAFTSSAKTSADRAALIGSLLKAANGDALSFAGSMSAVAVADKGFWDGIKQSASDAKQSTGQYLASVFDLKKGTIAFNNTAAAPMIQALDGVQSAAMAAASAVYQHKLKTESGTKAADDAYKVYRTRTVGMFEDAKGKITDQAKAMHLNQKQADILSKSYFGLKGDVKTKIEAVGGDPVVTLLEKIGTLLETITRKVWGFGVDVDISKVQPSLDAAQSLMDNLKQNRIPGVTVDSAQGQAEVTALQTYIDGAKQGTIPVIKVDTLMALASTGGLAAAIAMLKDKQITVRELGAAMASGEIANLSGWVNGLPTSKDIWITVHSQVPANLPAAAWEPGPHAAGTGIEGLPQGWSSVGEQGAELAYHAGGRTHIFSHSKSKAMLARLGRKVPGFAAGTQKQDDLVTHSRAALTAIGTAPQAPQITISATGLQRTLDQLHHAATVIGDDIKKGLSAKNTQALERQLIALGKLARRQLDALTIKVKTSDMAALKGSLTKTAADVRTAFGVALSDLSKMGISAAQRSSLTAAERQIEGMVSKRDKLADALGTPAKDTTTAYDRLATAMDNVKSLAASVADAVKGSFDITTAGVSASGGAVSGEGILASSKQAVKRVRAFYTDLTKLGGMGLNKAYLTSLASKGPDALEEVDAILALGKSGIGSLNTDQKSIESDAAKTGAFAGNAAYGADVRNAQAQVDAMKKQLHDDNVAIARKYDALASRFDHYADAIDARPIVIKVDGKTILTAVRSAAAKAAR